MSDSPASSPRDTQQGKHLDGSSHHSQHLLESLDVTTQSPFSPIISKMRLGKSDSNSIPVSSGELPPLVGVHHVSNHSVAPDCTLLPAVCHGAVENDTVTAQNTPSPLMRRRLKYMVRQCSDSELLKINSGLGALKMTPASQSPVPHPPDQSPRSQNSSETNSPRILRNPQKLNSSRSGLGRVSRSLEASPMVVRRVRNNARGNAGDRDSTSSPVPPSPTPCSDQKRRPRPFSFGSYTDVLQYVGNNTEPPSMPGSPFMTRRSGSLRSGGVILPLSRPDTPANDALSMNESRKSNQMATSSGERNDIDDDETSLDENAFPRRRLRRDSGSQNAQRNSNAPLSSDCYRNIPRKSQHMISPSCVNENQYTPSHQHDEHEHLGHVGDDDIGYPSDLYDIQERRESILSIEAVQEIARRFASNNGANDSDTGTEEPQEPPKQEERRRFKKDNIPEYRKEPLSAEKRVSNWLKGIPDPTEGLPTSHTERLLPDII